MTGYDLQKRFGSSVGHVWHAPDSQIYPELRKMEQSGLLAGEEVPWGPRGTKTVYHVTQRGGSALREWMNVPLKYPGVRDPAHLKAAYLEYAEPPAARRHLLDHIEHHTELLQQWENQMDEIDAGTNATLNKRLRDASPDEKHRIQRFKRFAYEGLTVRAQHEINWAERGLRLLDVLYPGGESELRDPDAARDERGAPRSGAVAMEEDTRE